MQKDLRTHAPVPNNSGKRRSARRSLQSFAGPDCIQLQIAAVLPSRDYQQLMSLSKPGKPHALITQGAAYLFMTRHSRSSLPVAGIEDA